ncbi:MAG: hydroxyphenylacetyl-CoA thioesterase PaaI [Acidimicrobiia bacterium]
MVDHEDLAALARASAAEMWSEDRAAQGLGFSVTDVAPGAATVSMLVRDDMVNGHGVCHGGFIFTLADAAFSYACNTHGSKAVAAGADIVFVTAARLGDRLTATGRETLLYGRSGICDVVVTDQDGATVAHFRGRSRTVGADAPGP